MSDIDWEHERSMFPACQKTAYFTNASVTLFSKTVHRARREHIDRLYHEGERAWVDELATLNDLRAKTARLINAGIEDIGFGPNTSFQMNMFAMMLRQSNKSGNVVMPRDEFPSSSMPWAYHGFETRFVDSVQSEIRIADLLAAVDQDTAAVVCSAVQFSTGFRININALGDELASRKIPFFINATQALGAFPVDVRESQASGLAASVHKWLGSGFACSIGYYSSELRAKYRWPLVGWLSVPDTSSMSHGVDSIKQDASAIEMGTLPLDTFHGLSASLSNVERLGIKNIAQRILDTTNYLVDKLRAANISIKSFRDARNDVFESVNSGIVVINVSDPERVERELMQQSIRVNARRGSIRISAHYYNNREDVDRLVAALVEVCN